MAKRHQERTYTPGSQSPGKPEIKGFDQAIQDQYDGIEARRRELAARLATVKTEIGQIMANLGLWVAEGADWKEHTDQLADLKAEAVAMEAGLEYLRGQSGLLERSNIWLKR